MLEEGNAKSVEHSFNIILYSCFLAVDGYSVSVSGDFGTLSVGFVLIVSLYLSSFLYQTIIIQCFPINL